MICLKGGCLEGLLILEDLKYNFHSTAENHKSIGFIQIRTGALKETLGEMAPGSLGPLRYHFTYADLIVTCRLEENIYGDRLRVICLWCRVGDACGRVAQ